MKSAVPARLAGAPVAGYDAASAARAGCEPALPPPLRVAKTLHAVERSRRLLAAAVGYAMPRPGPPRSRAAAAPPAAAGLPSHYGLVLHATSWPTKLWPEDHWRPCSNAWRRAVPRPPFLGATRHEKTRPNVWPPASAMRSSCRASSAEPSSPRSVALPISPSGLDTGLMHLAAAYGVPDVSLFGPTDPTRSGPYGENQLVHPVRPCQGAVLPPPLQRRAGRPVLHARDRGRPRRRRARPVAPEIVFLTEEGRLTPAERRGPRPCR